MRHLKAVVFDWAGTMVDHGSLAPMGAFVEAFAQFGVDDHHRRGARADGHGQAAAHRGPAGAAAGRGAPGARSTGAPPSEADIDAVYEVFVPMNIAVAARYADLIAGRGRDRRRRCAALGLKIGSTTGYTREIMAEVTAGRRPPRALRPTAWSAPATRPTGGPTPFMLYRALPRPRRLAGLGLRQGRRHRGRHRRGAQRRRLDRRRRGQRQRVRPVAGRHARRSRRTRSTPGAQKAAGRLAGAGAHYVIDSVADLLPVIQAIEGRLARGERP